MTKQVTPPVRGSLRWAVRSIARSPTVRNPLGYNKVGAVFDPSLPSAQPVTPESLMTPAEAARLLLDELREALNDLEHTQIGVQARSRH